MESGLARPKRSVIEKGGKGIYRRFFYFIPSKGTGAVDRSRLPELHADEGTSRLHEFVDIGVPGRISTRYASCHRCPSCWSADRGEARSCQNAAYVGAPKEIAITKKSVPTAAVARIDRATLNRAGVERAEQAKEGTVVCFETHDNEQAFPWMIGKVVKTVHEALTASPAYNAERDPFHLDHVRAGDCALQLKLYEALEAGSTTYVESERIVLIAARRIRVIDVDLVECRGSSRTQAQMRQRFTIESGSLHKIRAEMPTSSDDWQVERVVQYSMVYGQARWLVKWQGYDESRNTWEPWEHLLTDALRQEAKAVRLAAAPTTLTAVGKLPIPELEYQLAERGLPTEGNQGRRALKAILVQRLWDAISASASGLS